MRLRESLELAIRIAKQDGHRCLEKEYLRILDSLAPAPGPVPKRLKPLVILLSPRNWCGERHARDLVKNMPALDCQIHFTGEDYKGPKDADMYLVRSISDLVNVNFPKALYGRVVSVLDSERAFWPAFRGAYRQIAGVVPINAWLAKEVHKYSPQFVAPVTPNGVNTDEFRPGFRFPQKFTAGCAGNFSLPVLDDWKGFSGVAVPACQGAEVKLKWCGWKGRNGDGTLLSKQVPAQEMNKWYRKLSCLLQLSRSEACSSIVFEAMASGLPVISTKTGWHWENCKDAGILWVDRDDPRIVKEVECLLRYLKKSPKNCEEMGRKNRRMAKAYAWKHTGLKWQSILLDIWSVL